MQIALLLFTIFVAASLSVGMWAIGIVEFNFYTSSLHVASIYIGVASVLAFQRWRERQKQ